MIIERDHWPFVRPYCLNWSACSWISTRCMCTAAYMRFQRRPALTTCGSCTGLYHFERIEAPRKRAQCKDEYDKLRWKQPCFTEDSEPLYTCITSDP
ncbi:hypothetical protein XHV734_4652 [Xanthomonas hortorum pv. vitians]|nr:hypothetical protein XHV734_4652 [Xanthomonas hortorum pv. vitians]